MTTFTIYKSICSSQCQSHSQPYCEHTAIPLSHCDFTSIWCSKLDLYLTTILFQSSAVNYTSISLQFFFDLVQKIIPLCHWDFTSIQCRKLYRYLTASLLQSSAANTSTCCGWHIITSSGVATLRRRGACLLWGKKKMIFFWRKKYEK